MHKSKTIQKAKNSKNETVYLTIKTRTGFHAKNCKCVVLVKTSKQIIYQSRTCVFEGYDYFIALDTAQIFFDDATGSNKLVQLPLFK